MAEKNKGEGDLNLELPSLSLRRKRKDKAAAELEAPAPSDQAKSAQAESAQTESAQTESAQTEDTVVLPTASTDTDRFAPKEAPSGAAEPAPYVPEPAAADGPVDATTVRTEKPKPSKAEKPPKEPRPAMPSRELTLPGLPAMTASILTGALVGILACGATWLGLQGCQAIKGTSSCGGPGFLLLLVILVLLVFIGSALLRVWRVTDPGSTSFLAVGLMTVIVLLFLVDVIFEWWMIIVIPLVAAAMFALSHWVTVKFIETGDVS
jgi:hypothetical protein